MQTQEQKRKENSLKSTYFNRYLMLRYSLAAMFFGNLYWLLVQLFNWTLYAVIPIILLIYSILAIAEQFKMYGTKEVYLTKTRLFFNLQSIVQILLIALVLCTDQISIIFPIFTAKLNSKLIIAFVLGLGQLVSLFILHRIRLILEGRDRALLRLQQLEKIM